MSRKIKVKTVKVSLGGTKDEGLAEMFNQMLGAGSVNLTIAYPRYVRIKGLCEQLVKLFELLVDSPFMRAYSEFAPQKQQIEKFCQDARAKIASTFIIDLSDWEWNLSLVDDELRKAFSAVYEPLKAGKFDLVSTFIILCDHLVAYKKNFENLSKLNYKFITSMPGAEWCPFPFTNLNLKYVFSLTSVGENTITFFMTLLNKAYEFSRGLYEEIQSPDVDVDQFVGVIMRNIDEIQKRPELNRCRKAFQKIKDSVSLLKNKFNGYYRDFIATKDSTIMMQHFIIDVSKSTDADPQTTAQFRTIIQYYKKLAQSQITDPKIKMLFDRVNESFEELEKGTENLVKIRDEEEGPDSDAITVSAPIAQTREDVLTAAEPTPSNDT